MSFCFIGYFPKKIARATDEMGLPGVSEIWSVSNCISSEPKDWIQHWRHNVCWLFDTPDLARSVVPADAAHEFRVVGYRIWSDAFGDAGSLVRAGWTSARLAAPTDFDVVGYDAVSSEQGYDFDHSPLSCNGAAKEFAANARCLFATFDAAIAGAGAFAAGRWEPGPYYVVEVLAQRGSA